MKNKKIKKKIKKAMNKREKKRIKEKALPLGMLALSIGFLVVESMLEEKTKSKFGKTIERWPKIFFKKSYEDQQTGLTIPAETIIYENQILSELKLGEKIISYKFLYKDQEINYKL